MIPEDWARQCNMGAARGLSMSDRLVCRDTYGRTVWTPLDWTLDRLRAPVTVTGRHGRMEACLQFEPSVFISVRYHERWSVGHVRRVHYRLTGHVRPLALYVHLVGHSRCVYMYGAGRDEEEFSDALVRLSAG